MTSHETGGCPPHCNATRSLKWMVPLRRKSALSARTRAVASWVAEAVASPCSAQGFLDSAELIEGRVVAKRGLVGRMGPSDGPAEIDRLGRCGPRPRCSPRLPKAEMEEPAIGALATERLAERGARIGIRRPTADNSARGGCEGRTGLPNRSRPPVPVLRWTRPMPDGAEDRREG